MGYAIVSFTITETGTVEDVEVLEGWCGDPADVKLPAERCTEFNKSSINAAKKLKYKPQIIRGNAVKVYNVTHKFTYLLED